MASPTRVEPGPGPGTSSDAIVLSRAQVERDLAWSVGILLVGAALWVWGLFFADGALAGSVGGASSSTGVPASFWFVEILSGAGGTMVLVGGVFAAINASLRRRGRRASRVPM